MKGVSNVQHYKTPVLNSQGQWAELRTPPLSLLSGNYFLAFQRLIEPSSPQPQLLVRLLDSNNNPIGQPFDVSSGSGAAGGVAYPAQYVNSIAVGASTDFDLRSDYSQFGPELFCVAPSMGGWNDVATTDTSGPSGYDGGDSFMGFGGTSAATPLAAGVAALVLSKNSNLTPAQLKDSLRLSCDKVGHLSYDPTTLWNEQYGYGRVNAYSSLTVTAADMTAPTVTSVVTRTGRRVEVTFSEKMGSGVTTPANYFIAGTGQGTLASNPSSVTWVSGNKYLLEWSAGEMIAGTSNIAIVASAASVKDIAGNGLQNPNYGYANGSRVIHAIDCGPVRSNATYPIYPFESQRNYWSGPYGANLAESANMILNNDGTPTAVYTSEQSLWASPNYQGDIVYTLPNITSGINHNVRLYFFNNGFYPSPGDVVFDIYINDVLNLASFDLIAETYPYGSGVGLWREFSNITAQNGAITVRIVPLAVLDEHGFYYYAATVSGIKVSAQ